MATTSTLVPKEETASTGTMQALVYHGPGRRSWETRPRPKLQESTDAIVRVSATTICGTDLHILKGDVPSVAEGRTLGHEAVGYVEEGMASWYGPDFHGGRTSTGETYDMEAMSGAHPTLPLPTWVRVTNLENGRSVVVRLNDRGPFAKGRIIDLSRAAAEPSSSACTRC